MRQGKSLEPIVVSCPSEMNKKLSQGLFNDPAQDFIAIHAHQFFSCYQSPIEPLLPHLTNHSSSRNKSARSSGSLLLEDGQLALPKTFVTRKGAILLFTPSDEVCNHSNEESHFKKENVFEAGLKLRTVGNLTNSVLEFGKEVRL